MAKLDLPQRAIPNPTEPSPN